MYGYTWKQGEHEIFELSVSSCLEKEIRPVFKEELDFFNMYNFWHYPETEEPLLWAEGIRRYIVGGDCVAEAKGGGFYTKPEMKVRRDNLYLKPINGKVLSHVNNRLMKGLEQRAISFIQATFKEYKAKGYNFIVAFSGGKDSLVLLDLVQKALPPDEFYVIFSNTDMELSVTLTAIERSKKHWKNLRFYEAKSHLPAEKSWSEFGPPGRRMRWCCAVHKSVPTMLLLRQLTGNNEVKAVVFDGVRAEESSQRSRYEEITHGGKNTNQINCSPILRWNSAEVFIYLLSNNILFNDAYRIGLFRVGCSICPLSSRWWDAIANCCYETEMSRFLSVVEKYADKTKPRSERKKYIESGGWKGRMGGRGLAKGGNRIYETFDNNMIKFAFSQSKQNWVEVMRILGPVVERNNNSGQQAIESSIYDFCVDKTDGRLVVTYNSFDKPNKSIISRLRGIANKVAYCIGCKACMVECPTSAFVIDENSKIVIRENKCIHCNRCLTFTDKGCLVAKSLSTTMGANGMDLKGMNRYQHFGLRQSWLIHFFNYKTDCFTKKELGNRQYDSLKVWLREAELIEIPKRGSAGAVTPLFEKLIVLGPYNPLTWAIIWVNLGYNSTIVRWYMRHVPPGEIYEKSELVFMLGDDYSQSTRDNAITSLTEIFRFSPIGSVLKQGIPLKHGNSFKFNKAGWDFPEDAVLLYSLYKWAEKTGRYNFTLTQMEKARIDRSPSYLGIDPVLMFAIEPKRFRDLLQALAVHYENYIRVSFVADLDNIALNQEVSTLDVLDLII